MEVVWEGLEVHTRDHTTKREEYLVFGVREYWIVDPEARSMIVLVRDGDIWVEQVFQNEEQTRSSILPGLAIKVSDLWAEIKDEENEESSNERAA
jgi:Uma2 family endonuclease